MRATARPAPDLCSDDVTAPQRAGWDLLVIGGGTAGLVAAKTAAGFGASVLLVEAGRTGGDCLWTGCVPSKALLAAAHAAAGARAAAGYGIHAGAARVEFAEVMAHVRSSIATIEPNDSPAALRAAGVRVAHARARFAGAGEAKIGGEAVRFRQALVATGSAPDVPPIPGLIEADPLTSDTIWDLADLPGRLLVLGGGSIGCELGQAFARLGSQVTIVETAPTLLPREDPRAGTLLLAALAEDGLAVNNGVSVTAITSGHQQARAQLSNGGTVAFDAILVATGRRPRTSDLGLAHAGVEIDGLGNVRVNRRLQTSNPRVWAAGDVTGHPRFTHTAGVHGSLAAGNAVLGLRRAVDLATIPRVTYTQPEVASFGAGAGQAAGHSGLSVHTVPHDQVDRAITDRRTAGFTRLVLDHKGRIAGATIVGPRAGESLAELVLAARHGLRARDLAAAMHAYPTYADGVWKAALADLEQRLRRAGPRRVIRGLAAARRAVPGARPARRG